MRITVMHNPGAGDENHTADEIVTTLERAGHEVAYQSTRKRKFHRALDEPADLVVVAGGDGAVKKVATRLAGRGLPFAILPFGTANNVAKALGAVAGLHELAGGLEGAKRLPVDLGIARAPFGERRFIEALGGGPFARMVRGGSRASDDSPQLPGNKIDRALQLLRREVAQATPRPWLLRADAHDLSGDYLLVEVMNMRLIGPNVRLAPSADPGDGRLDVVAVPDSWRSQLLRYLDARLAGDSAPLELPVHRARRVELSCDGELLHVDDAPWPESPDEDDDDEEGAASDDVERRGGENGSGAEGPVLIDVEAGALEAWLVETGTGA